MPPTNRPLNHVEMALEANARLMRPQVDPSGEPFWSPEQIAWMEKNWPPRCLGLHEQVEDHLRYAGIVDWVAARRNHYDQQLTFDEAEHV